MSVEVLFITHAEVVISAEVPVPDWPLSPEGRARHRAQAEALRHAPPTVLWSSDERKALDAAGILSGALGLAVHVDPRLGENDRSATGYLPAPLFEAAADAFFAHPDESYRGWETARAAQARIVTAMDGICAAAADGPTPAGPVAVCAHGGVGALLLAHVTGVKISRALDQPGRGGGNCFRYLWPGLALQHGWRDISRG